MLLTDQSEVQYGSSTSLCDYILSHQIQDLKPSQIVDFGAGGGKNGIIIRNALPNVRKLIAVEGYEKAAQMLSAGSVYDEVHHSLIEEWLLKDTNTYDLAVFGDVLEHLPPREIHKVIRRCLKKFATIIIVCPLHDIFQDDAYGNSLEVHRAYITSGFFDRYKIIEKHIIAKEGWTIANIQIQCKPDVIPAYKIVSSAMFHCAMLILQPIGAARPFVNVLKRWVIRYKWLLRG